MAGKTETSKTEKKHVIPHLWLIRHAQSLWNTGAIKDEASIPNCPLSENGRKQATTIQGPVDLLILSPLRRAMETYVLSRLQVKRVLVSELFREHMTGPSNNFELEDRTKRETPEDLQRRVQAALALLRSQPEMRIAILSHHDFLLALTRHFQPIGHAISLQNAQVLHLVNVSI